jgi:hypothetical protein
MRLLVLTRLAVGQPSADWLARRLHIFEMLCAPSMAMQSCQDFRWVLAVAPDTPAWFLSRVLAIAPRSVLVYHEGQSINPDWPRLVAPFCGDGRLITTRLDSDDMLHQRFIEIVRYYAAHCSHDTVIDFPAGVKLRLSDFAYQTMTLLRPTHFISLVEMGRPFRTVYQCAHQEIDQRYPVWLAAPHPAWVEVCHLDNIYNHFDHWKRGPPEVTTPQHLFQLMSET